VNEVTLHPRILKAVSQLLSCEISRLRLTQSDLWPKQGRPGPVNQYDNWEQRIHVDYPNHYLTHPPPWDSPEAVEMIVYFDHVEESGGPTTVVKRTGPDDEVYRWPIVQTPGVGAVPWINDKTCAETYLKKHHPDLHEFREKLYAREAAVKYSPGTILFYRHDTWHRGTPVKMGALRLVMNLTFKLADSFWISGWNSCWAKAMYTPEFILETIVAKGTVDQRCVLGFPEPGHKYWTRETVEAVTARYGPLGFDPSPYLAALPCDPSCPRHTSI